MSLLDEAYYRATHSAQQTQEIHVPLPPANVHRRRSNRTKERIGMSMWCLFHDI